MSKKERIDRIREAFKEFKVTGYEVAKHCPVTETGVNKILNGTIVRPNDSTLEILESYLQENYGLSIPWLQTGKGPKIVPVIPSEADFKNFSDNERQAIIKELSIFIAYHKKQFFEDEVFKSIVEQRAYEMVIDIMKKDSQR